MIRNVCIHVANEQPLLADLYALPTASDAGLVCTNVRGLDGKRPVFIDHMGSTFFFPYHVVRFLEIPTGAAQDLEPSVPGREPSAAAGPDADASRANGEDAPDAQRPPESAEDRDDRLPVVVGSSTEGSADDPDTELEIDEGFLQRIRDI